MLTQSKGKIFLSEERGLTEIEWYRSYNTFNFGGYFNEHKVPFGALYVVNEDTLSGGRTLAMQVDEGSDIMLIPIVGAIAYKDSAGNSGLVEAGQVQLVRAPKGVTFELTNPFESELVKFLQVWCKNSDIKASSNPLLYSFDLDGNKNRLVELFTPSPAALLNAFAPLHASQNFAGLPVGLIGKFMGREEAVYQVMDSSKGIWAFVIEGVFEVQYRLLHPGDGLALWGVQEVELEALSNDAIIFLVEVPMA